MQGEYIVDRLLPVYVKQACERLGFACTFFSDDWVIQINAGSKRRFVIGYAFDINSAGAVGVASDKVASSLILANENIPVVMHYLIRTHAEQELLTHNAAHIPESEQVVIKPLSGSGGKGVALMSNKAAAFDFIRASTHPDWALSPYYDIVQEKRAVMCDGRILCAYDKTNPHEQNGLRMFNLSQGAVAVNCELSERERALAFKALLVSGLRAASVDIALCSDGTLMVMEVNTGFMMQHYAKQSEEYDSIAADVYFEIVKAMMEKSD